MFKCKLALNTLERKHHGIYMTIADLFARFILTDEKVFKAGCRRYWVVIFVYIFDISGYLIRLNS